MIYLIGQLGMWLLLTAGFAALAGWAFAAERAAPAARALEREREGLLRDLSRLASGESDIDDVAIERESDAMRRLLEVRDGRIAELEHALEQARARGDEAASRIAELERSPERGSEENAELARLRALTAQYEEERAREVDVEAEPVVDDRNAALQVWRLRYFEQRVKYLEGKAALAPAAGKVAPTEPLHEWRTREAEARAAHLEQELRTLRAAPEPREEAAPFAANASVDMLLRWRMLYLERRAAHLQAELARAQTPTSVYQAPAEASLDSDRWKWRARYLEARVRHLEQRPMGAAPVRAVPAPAEEAPALRPAVPGEKPPILSAARDGAPDDFTLIEDVSVLQQTTLYSIGVFHFDQIAEWTPAHVAWIDQYLRLRGRIDSEEWVEQARELARRGVAASRRMLADEDA